MLLKLLLQNQINYLGKISKPLQFGARKQLMDDMLDTMYDANGIGLAAIQIGVPKRIIVMDISKRRKKRTKIFC